MPTGVYTRTKKHLEQIKKMTESNRGISRSEETKKKISEKNKVSLLGNIPWNKGKKCPQLSGENHGMFGKTHTIDVKKKLSEHAKNRTSEKSHLWKGDSVKYRALHMWVESRLGKPTMCEFCKKDGFKSRYIDWANISKKYKRDLSDWVRLCRKCHKEFDKK